MEKIVSPTTAKERHVVLDALRGLALLGIALANFPEFALWTFLSADEQSAMPTAGVDRIVRFLQYMLVDGKFYTIFSLLFGVGFALILSRHSISLFVRRMAILIAIGACHLMFLWSGDILLLYAIGGLLLPMCLRLKDKQSVLMVSCSRTDGTQQLPVAVAHRRTAVLWTWLRPRLLDGARLYRVDSARCVCRPDSYQRLVATVVPLRTFGVDLAHADIRKLLQDMLESHTE